MLQTSRFSSVPIRIFPEFVKDAEYSTGSTDSGY